MRLDELLKMKQYEKKILVLRRHWASYLPTVLLYLLLALIPVVIFLIFNQPGNTTLSTPYLKALLILLGSAYELCIALFFYANFLIYYLDMLIVTSDRLVMVSQGNLFARKVSELDLFRIQDCTSNVRGFWRTIFDFGDLEIQTAGERENFVFANLPRPHEIRRQLLQLADTDRKFHLSEKTYFTAEG